MADQCEVLLTVTQHFLRVSVSKDVLLRLWVTITRLGVLSSSHLVSDFKVIGDAFQWDHTPCLSQFRQWGKLSFDRDRSSYCKLHRSIFTLKWIVPWQSFVISDCFCCIRSWLECLLLSWDELINWIFMFWSPVRNHLTQVFNLFVNFFRSEVDFWICGFWLDRCSYVNLLFEGWSDS